MSDTNEDHTNDNELLRLTAEIVASYVGNNSLSADQVPEIVRTVSSALKQIEQGENGPQPPDTSRRTQAPKQHAREDQGNKVVPWMPASFSSIHLESQFKPKGNPKCDSILG